MRHARRVALEQDVMSTSSTTAVSTAPRWKKAVATALLILAVVVSVTAVLLLIVPPSRIDFVGLAIVAITGAIECGIYFAMRQNTENELSVRQLAGRLLLIMIALLVCGVPVVWFLSRM